MVDLERFSAWTQATTAFRRGDKGPLVQFIKTWGAESEAEREFVASAIEQPPPKQRANGRTKHTLADAYRVAKTHQRIMKSAGVTLKEGDLIALMAQWLNMEPESINTLLHRHGIKGK